MASAPSGSGGSHPPAGPPTPRPETAPVDPSAPARVSAEAATPPPDEPDLDHRMEAAKAGQTALDPAGKASLASRGVLHPTLDMNTVARDVALDADAKAAADKLKAAREKGDAAVAAAQKKAASAAPPAAATAA